MGEGSLSGPAHSSPRLSDLALYQKVSKTFVFPDKSGEAPLRLLPRKCRFPGDQPGDILNERAGREPVDELPSELEDGTR